MDIIPYDAWVEVFKNISFEERICQLQRVCNDFAKVCGDAKFNTRLDFTDLVSVSDRCCLETIMKATDAVRYMSFRNCTWFSKSVFADMPTLSNLVTLDLIGIDPCRYNLSSFLAKTPLLENLRLEMSDSTLSDFVNHHAEHKECKILNLDVLHVELFCGDMLTRELKTQYINRFIEICCHEKPRSVSIDDKYRDAEGDVDIKRLFPRSTTAIYPGEAILQGRNGFDEEDVSKMLKCYGLHCIRKDSHSKLNLSEVRFISLPFGGKIQDDDSICACDGTPYPSTLPALEYLSACASLKETAHGCYAATVGGILMECEMPRLTHLDLGKGVMNGEPPTAKFYQRLRSFINLVELSVICLNLDLVMLLDATKDLDHLQALAICVNNSILNRTGPSSLSSNRDRAYSGDVMSTRFFGDLVRAFPNLKKLELESHDEFMDAISSTDLLPISSLSKLEHFLVRGMSLKDVHEFELILRNLENLKSLVLDDRDNECDCDFSKLTRSLQWLPNLTHLHLSQREPLALEVLQDLTKCKLLQSIFIGNVFADNRNVRQINMALDTLFDICQYISKLCITTESFLFRRSISKCESRMRSNGRSVRMLYKSHYATRDVKGWHDRYLTQPQVANCDPFDILV